MRRSAAVQPSDPPSKHLHRDTLSYLNEQSARLISALSRLMHAIACDSHPSYIVYITYCIVKTQNQISTFNDKRRSRDLRSHRPITIFFTIIEQLLFNG